MVHHVKKISVETAVKILTEQNFEITIEDARIILNFLYELTELAMIQISREESLSKSDE